MVHSHMNVYSAILSLEGPGREFLRRLYVVPTHGPVFFFSNHPPPANHPNHQNHHHHHNRRRRRSNHHYRTIDPTDELLRFSQAVALNPQITEMDLASWFCYCDPTAAANTNSPTNAHTTTTTITTTTGTTTHDDTEDGEDDNNDVHLIRLRVQTAVRHFIKRILPRLPLLDKLRLSGWNLTASEVFHLLLSDLDNDHESLHHREYYNGNNSIHHHHHHNGALHCSVVPHLHRLTRLDLSNNPHMGVDGARAIALWLSSSSSSSSSCKPLKLEWLNVSNCTIGDAGCAAILRSIASSDCGCLRVLYLDQNRIAFHSPLFLTAANNMMHFQNLTLTGLSLNGNDIDNTGMLHLCRALRSNSSHSHRHHPFFSLRWLSLADNPYTYDTALHQSLLPLVQHFHFTLRTLILNHDDGNVFQPILRRNRITEITYANLFCRRSNHFGNSHYTHSLKHNEYANRNDGVLPYFPATALWSLCLHRLDPQKPDLIYRFLRTNANTLAGCRTTTTTNQEKAEKCTTSNALLPDPEYEQCTNSSTPLIYKIYP